MKEDEEQNANPVPRGVMEERDLRALLRAIGTRRRNQWSCLSETTLAAFAERQLEEKVRMKAERHLAACLRCRAQLADLVRLVSAETLEDVPPELLSKAKKLAATQSRPLPVRRWQWAAAASALVVVLLVVTVQKRKPGSTPASPTPSTPRVEESPSRSVSTVPEAVPGLDTSRGTTVQSGIPALLSPREGTILAIKQSEFRWTAVPGTLFYEVQVLTVDGNIAWAGRTRRIQLAIPKQVALKPGKYFVWVRARLVDGKTRKSQAVSFLIPAER